MSTERTFKIHYLVPAKSAPAPHHTSGPPITVLSGGDMETRLGTGVPHVAACNPKIVLEGKWHHGTGEPHAVRCTECFETDVFKRDILLRPHPRSVQQPLEADPLPDHLKGCCGG